MNQGLVQGAEESGTTVLLLIAFLGTLSIGVAVGMMYAVWHRDRLSRARLSRSRLNLPMGAAIGFAATTAAAVWLYFYVGQYLNARNIWLSVLFLVVTIPLANLLAMISVIGFTTFWRWRENRQCKVAPYLGPVSQNPVDVELQEPLSRPLKPGERRG